MFWLESSKKIRAPEILIYGQERPHRTTSYPPPPFFGVRETGVDL